MPNAIETARELAKPGSVYTPADQRALVAGAEAIAARGGARDDTDRCVVSAAERLAFYVPAPEPQATIPPALLDKIAETEATIAIELGKAGAALEAVVVARRIAERAEKPEEAERAAAAARTAERNYEDACIGRDRVSSQLTRLRLQVETIKRKFAAALHVTPSTSRR